MGVPTATCLAFSSTTPSTIFQSPPALGRPRYPSFLPKQSASSPLDKIFQFQPYSRTALKASSSSSNKTKPPPLPKTEDPFLLLGLDSRNPTTDTKEIKRAYRKRAMQYHPDVILGPESTAQERDEASKDFARINAAYEMLTGGGKGGVGAGSSAGSGSGAKTTSGGYNYQPPHRRTSGYSSGSYGKSTNWEDFMPKYDEEDAKYDADGDSFGAISDLLTGAAGYAAGVGGSGGGIFGDFIEFLEGNIDGFESGYDDDKSLAQLLMYGSFDEVASEMDETDILVTSLETKLNTVENELMQVQADLNVATRFSEKLDIEERMAELKAREKVVKGYLKKGKKRLLRLRERYKELMVQGRGGRGYGDSSSSAGSTSGSGSYSSSSSQNGSYSSAGSSRSSSYSRASEPGPSASATASTSTSSTPTSSPASSSTNSWRNEGFSSSYGSRSSSSRRSSRRNRGATNNGDASRTAAEQQPNQQQQQQQWRANENTYSSSAGRNSGNAGRATSSRGKPDAPQQYEPWVPPHRRTQSTGERTEQDKKRLRELKVDDDFEKLKREMGM